MGFLFNLFFAAFNIWLAYVRVDAYNGGGEPEYVFFLGLFHAAAAGFHIGMVFLHMWDD